MESTAGEQRQETEKMYITHGKCQQILDEHWYKKYVILNFKMEYQKIRNLQTKQLKYNQNIPQKIGKK